jgi:predicted ATPase/DNA-binding SARP family transcriptional activator
MRVAMEFWILGPLEARGQGRVLEICGAKRRALLAVLALQANRPVSVDRLAGALWGEEAPPGAVKAIQVAVSRLRRALGDDDVLETTSAGYRLVLGPDELDLERFERALAAGRKTLAAGDAARAARLLRGALDLWRGPPLEEFAWAPFAPPEIRRLEELQLSALESRIEADLVAGRHAELVVELQRLSREHPWREPLHAQLMLALYRSGRQGEALEAYRHAREVLVEQLGIEPGSELHRLHQAVLAHDAALDPPFSTVTAPTRQASALPAPPNRTIGRVRELRTIAGRLRDGRGRVLTLIGPGGVGKTRLAIEAARTVQADFADGAWFVSLAALERSRDVAGAIVSALKIVSVSGESPEEALERFLAAKHLLLVVDNCEHLAAAAPFIGSLPAAGPGVTVLATSREPLAVHAEQVLLVPPLAMSDPAPHSDLDGLLSVDAIALFCERARAHDPDFELSRDSAGPVAEICRRLDGLPLAIELAAARCALLSPSEIAARLGAAVSALGSGPRDAPARQQTLQATLDWSHGLLDDDEQTCFARMAVFAGGATIDAAETVVGADLDTLDRLVAKSLLVRRQGRHGPTRLGMLETVRTYANERFAALPDWEAVRERHFAHYLSVAHHHGNHPALDGPDTREHLACLDDELENFRAALRFAAHRDAGERVLELSVALVDYWQRRDRPDEALQWVLPALRDTDTAADPALRARALGKVIWPLWDSKRTDELPAVVAEAKTLAGRVPDLASRAEVLVNCTAIQGFMGWSDEAELTAEETLRTAQASGAEWMIAMAAWARAFAAGSTEEWHARIDEAAPLLASVGNVHNLHGLYCIAADSALQKGCDAEAVTYLDRCISLARDLQQPSHALHALNQIGLAALLRDDSAGADEAFREALPLSHDLGLSPQNALTGLAAVAALQGRPERAARLAGAVAAHHGTADHDDMQLRLQANFLEPARCRCSPGAWDASAGEGAKLSPQETTVYALEPPPVHDRQHPSTALEERSPPVDEKRG